MKPKSRRSTVIIQKNDEKSSLWTKHAIQCGLKFVIQPGSAILAPVYLVYHSMRQGLPSAYVTWYLNDYPAFTKTVFRLVSELVIVILCRTTRVSIYWICHNVDRESAAHYPTISKFRRALFSRVSRRIFTTDELFTEKAIKILRVPAHRVEAISFGELPQRNPVLNAWIDQVQKEINWKRVEATRSGEQFYVTLCLGNPDSVKMQHFELLERHIEESLRIGIRIVAIVGGSFGTTPRSARLRTRFRKNNQIILHDGYIDLPSRFIKANIDYYWRVYSDISVPYTLYESVTLRKPIITYGRGMLSELVHYYGIGAVISSDWSNVGAALSGIRNADWDFDGFLRSHSWTSLSMRLCASIPASSAIRKN